MWFRNPEDVDWHYFGGASDTKARRLACGKPLFIKPGTQKSPLAGRPACTRCTAVASRLTQYAQQQTASLDAVPAPQTQNVEKPRMPPPTTGVRPTSPKPQSVRPAKPKSEIVPGVVPQPGVIAPKPSYRWVRENSNSIWHYLASAEAHGPVCGAVGTFGESRYNLPAKVERCPQCGQEAARSARERALQKRGVSANDTSSALPPALMIHPAGNQSLQAIQPQPPLTPAAQEDSRLEQIATAGQKLSHLIEQSPDKLFPQVFAQLPRSDQEIINLAIQQRVWSDLFLSPTAQKAAQAARAANRPPNRAANASQSRNKKHAKPDRKPNR